MHLIYIYIYIKPKRLTHWGWVTLICIGRLTIIGSDNGLSPGQLQAIIWTNAGILLIPTLWTNFSEILSKIYTFSFKKMHLKMLSAKPRPFCLCLNLLTVRHMPQKSHYAGFSLLMLGIFHDSHHTWRVSVILYDTEPFTVVQSDFKGYHSWVVFQTLQNNFDWCTQTCCQTSNISDTLVCNKIVDHSDVDGALPVGAAPTTSSF